VPQPTMQPCGPLSTLMSPKLSILVSFLHMSQFPCVLYVSPIPLHAYHCDNVKVQILMHLFDCLLSGKYMQSRTAWLDDAMSLQVYPVSHQKMIRYAWCCCCCWLQ
jgi:hypothetical protein